MEEVTLNEAESRYFGDLFVCCDVEKTGKIPVLKSTELFRSANLSNDAIRQITSIVGIPQTAIHISRSQFYSCLKLIAAYQASVSPLRAELISSSINLPLPRFSWNEDLPLSAHLPTRRQSSVEKSSGMSSNKLGSSSNSSVSGVGGSTSSLTMEPNGLGTQSSEGKLKRRESHSPKHVGLTRTSVILATDGDKAIVPSELLSTDSEVEHNDSSGRVNNRNRGAGGSPEAWSTNSDSPTPTNSVAERPWAKETLWQGLLGDEHRQLLGTEEESSDRHSSEEDNETDLETIFQISNEQREYYHIQFKAIQPDPNGLVSGHIARVFFEKSKIPVEELRHIWQLCDVTRDGALSLAEFTSAMHLVVLRRNNIPLPNVLPQCLNPTILSSNNTHAPSEPPEADLLHLDDDDSSSAKMSVVDGSLVGKPNQDNQEAMRKIMATKANLKLNSLSNAAQVPENSKTRSSPSTQSKARSVSNTPPAEPTSPVHLRTKELVKGWTKFTESPTSNVSSPGPKPVNFDMQRTAQAVVSDPQILHPVPVRVTPVVGPESNDDDLAANRQSALRKSDNYVYDPSSGVVREADSSPKQLQTQLQQQTHHGTGSGHHRESLQNTDLRAIQRPQAKKLPVKNIGAIPPPPQREPSIGSGSGGDSVSYESGMTSSVTGTINPSTGGASVNVSNVPLPNKKEPPPLPPPRPRHARSSSLDLNKLKLSGNHPNQPEMIQQASFDMQSETTATGFADFAHFSDANKLMIAEKLSASYMGQETATATTTNSSSASASANTFIQPLPTSIPPPPRPTISSLQTNQRASAFEVYRKPNTPRSSQSPTDSQYHPQFQSLPPAPVLQQQTAHLTGSNLGPNSSALSISGNIPSTNSSNSSVSIYTGGGGGGGIYPSQQTTTSLDYEKRVMAISEQLRHVSLINNNNNNINNNSCNSNNNNSNCKLDKNVADILRHLREQNILLLRLCNDLSQELLQIQERKEEARCKLDSLNNGVGGAAAAAASGGGSASTTNANVSAAGGGGGTGGASSSSSSSGNCVMSTVSSATAGAVAGPSAATTNTSINPANIGCAAAAAVVAGGKSANAVPIAGSSGSSTASSGNGNIQTNITGGSSGASSVGTHSNI